MLTMRWPAGYWWVCHGTDTRTPCCQLFIPGQSWVSCCGACHLSAQVTDRVGETERSTSVAGSSHSLSRLWLLLWSGMGATMFASTDLWLLRNWANNVSRILQCSHTVCLLFIIDPEFSWLGYTSLAVSDRRSLACNNHHSVIISS